MNKEDDKTVFNQYAWILNYQPNIQHQHNYVGGKPVDVESDENCKEVKDDLQEQPKTKEDSPKQLKLTTPRIVLQRMLEGEWFDKVSANKDTYNKVWRNGLIADLMASEHGAYIAELWTHRDKILSIKGRLVGTLAKSGALKGSNLAIARCFLGIDKNTRDEDEKKEASTFAKYMGQWQKEPYADWIIQYVSR